MKTRRISGDRVLVTAKIAELMDEDIRKMLKPEAVDHPSHYGGDTLYEHVKVAEALGWVRNAFIYNCTKYIWRFGLKDNALQDLKKARWYLDREIKRLENDGATPSAPSAGRRRSDRARS